MTTLSLRFRAADTRAVIICTYQFGALVQTYSGHRPYKTLLAEAPSSVVQFENICRQKFQLGRKWQCTSLIGERA